jgi:tRNA(Ile)-lysidine synthase
VDRLERLEDAVRLRVLRLAALRAGCPPGELSRSHVLAVDALVTRWHGQRWLDLPGPVRAHRESGELHFRRDPVGG